MVGRVENMTEKKRWKFNEDAFKKLKDEKGDLLARMMTDTQDMSRIARQYLCFAANPRFVYGIPGQLTSKLRDHWGLNSILSEQKEKDRTDHRHHAIDAFVVACTGRGTLQKMRPNGAISAKCRRKKRRTFLFRRSDCLKSRTRLIKS